MSERSLNEYIDIMERSITNIRADIAHHAKGNVTLLAATKTVPAEAVNYAIDNLGITDIGENRVQELLEKYDALHKERLNIHFIGRLQTNKVKYIIDKVCLIHSLDSEKLAAEIDRQARKIGKVMDVLVEINIGGEQSKGGISPENAEEYRSLLEKTREKEIVRGCTGSGPQLDEFEFLLNGKQLRYYGSTGQIRLISLLLKLAEFNLVRRSAKEKVAVLVDDVTGELDEENKIRFFETISDADQQFYTFTEFPSLAFFADAEEIPVNRAILRGG